MAGTQRRPRDRLLCFTVAMTHMTYMIMTVAQPLKRLSTATRLAQPHVPVHTLSWSVRTHQKNRVTEISARAFSKGAERPWLAQGTSLQFSRDAIHLPLKLCLVSRASNVLRASHIFSQAVRDHWSDFT